MQIDSEPDDGAPFDGAKLALYLGPQLVVILRDATPGLGFADHWDLPGGGREGRERPSIALCASAKKSWACKCLELCGKLGDGV